jgi:hypothetical protein
MHEARQRKELRGGLPEPPPSAHGSRAQAKAADEKAKADERSEKERKRDRAVNAVLKGVRHPRCCRPLATVPSPLSPHTTSPLAAVCHASPVVDCALFGMACVCMYGRA